MTLHTTTLLAACQVSARTEGDFAKVHHMKKALVDEWVRLNPKFVQEQDGVWDTIKHAVHETLHGFFAPLLLLKWIVQSAFETLLRLR